MKSAFQQQAAKLKKPLKRSTTKAHQRKAQNANTRAVREAVFARDDTCRIPWCEGWQVVEMAHLDAKGMGGDPVGARTTTANCICCCPLHHQSARSLHSGHIKYTFLTDKGADGPMAFTFYEKLPSEL